MAARWSKTAESGTYLASVIPGEALAAFPITLAYDTHPTQPSARRHWIGGVQLAILYLRLAEQRQIPLAIPVILVAGGGLARLRRTGVGIPGPCDVPLAP